MQQINSRETAWQFRPKADSPLVVQGLSGPGACGMGKTPSEALNNLHELEFLL